MWRMKMRKYKKRLCAAAMTIALSFGVAAGAAIPTSAEEMTFEQMKQAAYDVLPETNSLEGWPQGPQVYAKSAIVMDMKSGAILYGKKIDEQHYPASITKLMTALVALENSKMDDEVLFSEDSVSFLEPGDASIGMTPGEILNMNDALHGMLLASANEVSYAIAESVGKKMGGGFDTFIQKMNDRSKELGCTGSHWTNANGLHDEQHYTTAHDMALIGAAMYQFEESRAIMQTLNYTIGTTNLVNETRTFQQNHKMLWPGHQNYYEYCTGGKTGYTDQAKTTLVTMADNSDMQLVAVVLEDVGDVYVDTRSMYDYAYGNFSKVPIAEGLKPAGVKKYQNTDAYIVLPTGADQTAVKKEIAITDKTKAAGVVTYTYNGQLVGKLPVELTAKYVEEETGYKIKPVENKTEKKPDKKEEKTGLSLVAKIFIGLGAAILIFFAGLYGVLKYRQIQIRKRRALARKRRQMEMRRRQREAAQRRNDPYREDRRRHPYQDYDQREYRVRERRLNEYGSRDRNGRYR